MAWYRAGGGGIPSSLKSDMNDVLNKKFGTSTDYPAEGWPDTVNLMGPLPEKTVSGAIVTFSDGADDVPLKKCEITLPASLDGYSSVDVIHAGKNLWEFGNQTVDTIAYVMLYFSKPIPAGTYTISCELISTTTTCSFRFRKEDGSYLEQTTFQANVGRVSKTLTISEPAYRVYIYSSTQVGGEVTTWKNVQIEVGSTMTDFVAYTAPTTHTADLERTIYGGSVDVVAGEGVDENDNPFTFDPVPIDSKLGNNTLWSEQGSTEVTYRADINLALGGQ